MSLDAASAPLLKDLIFQRIDELSPAEKRVARALLARYPGAGLESAGALSRAAGTSKPTVLRLLNRLGFGSYPEFQERLRNEVTRSLGSPVSRARQHLADTGDDTVFGRSVMLRAGLVDRLAETVPPGEVERVVELLSSPPKQVVVSGGYFSRLMARMLSLQLDQLIPNVDYADEPLGRDVGKYLRLSGKDSVVIVFDLRRYELAAKELVALAKSRGASVVLITDEALSPSAEEADIVLPVAVDGVPFDSFAALLVLVEALVDAVFHALGDKAIERMTDWEHSVHIYRAFRAAAPGPRDAAGGSEGAEE